MSNKWRSSKKVSVSGSAFKRARLATRNEDEDLKRGEYGHGSQEWLAEQARVSTRTVNELEAGRATVKTVDAVSNVLAINGREYIQGYGEDFTTCRATGVVDFRPRISGRVPGNETAYLQAAFFVTLDPLVIIVDDDFTDTAKMQRMELNLTVGDMSIDFSWLYSVNLTNRATTWLGDEEDVREVDIITHEPHQKSYMFRQDSHKQISWEQFINHLEATDDHRILLTVKIVFEHFERQDHILVAVEEMKSLFEVSYPKKYPYWVQPKALMV